MTGPTPQPGWYPDAQGQTRYWDGSAWGALAPASPPSYQPPPGPPPKRKRKTWPWVLLGLALLIIFVAIGASGIKSSPKKAAVVNNPATTTNAVVLPSAGGQTSAPSQDAHVGDTITLHDDTDGNFDLTLNQVVVTAKPSEPDVFSPSAGTRWFAAQFTIAPAADSNGYDDAPSNGAKAIDDQGQQYDAEIGDPITAGPAFGGDVKVLAGKTAKGWLVFEVPKTATITSVQFGLSSGFSATGEWIVP